VSAAGPGETPADCRRGGEPTAFGDVLFGKAFKDARSITGAFEAAKASLAGRDATPVMHVGAAIAQQLERLAAIGRNARCSACRRVR